MVKGASFLVEMIRYSKVKEPDLEYLKVRWSDFIKKSFNTFKPICDINDCIYLFDEQLNYLRRKKTAQYETLEIIRFLVVFVKHHRIRAIPSKNYIGWRTRSLEIPIKDLKQNWRPLALEFSLLMREDFVLRYLGISSENTLEIVYGYQK
jgi:hypothetical protein